MRSFLFSSLLLLLVGCNSSQDPTTGTTRVGGQVVDKQSRKGVANAQVQVWHSIGTTGGYGRVGSPYPADAQGRFSFDFNATSSQDDYIVLATAAPGYITDWHDAPTLTAGRTNENLVIPTLAPAWVRLQLVDEPPKTRAVVYLSGYEGPGDVLYYPRDTTLIRPCTANFARRINWGINATGTIVSYYQNVNPGPLDTMTVRIPF